MNYLVKKVNTFVGKKQFTTIEANFKHSFNLNSHKNAVSNVSG